VTNVWNWNMLEIKPKHKGLIRATMTTITRPHQTFTNPSASHQTHNNHHRHASKSEWCLTVDTCSSWSCDTLLQENVCSSESNPSISVSSTSSPLSVSTLYVQFHTHHFTLKWHTSHFMADALLHHCTLAVLCIHIINSSSTVTVPTLLLTKNSRTFQDVKTFSRTPS